MSSHLLYEGLGVAMDVEAEERFREHIYVLAVHQPDLFGHGIPKKVVERNVRVGKNTAFISEGDFVFGPSGPTGQGLSWHWCEADCGHRG